jgi:glyoxylase-like metal-dependent hydrolase (beta-lactamase superfamily II)
VKPNVESFYHPPTGSWSHVVYDASGGTAAIIDSVLDYDPVSGRTGTTAAQVIAEYVERERLRVEWILETHVHADHLTAAQYLKGRVGGRIAIGAGVCAVQENCRRLFDLGADFRTDGSQFDHLFADGEEFDIGKLRARVIATPGHTSDGVAYLIGDAVFIGDTLFAPDSGSARCDFPGGSARQLHESIERLYALPDDTRVFLCHDYPDGKRDPCRETTIAEQKSRNTQAAAGTTADAFVAFRERRDAGLGLPRLIFPAIQVNVRAGAFPAPAANGVRYLKIPLDTGLTPLRG